MAYNQLLLLLLLLIVNLYEIIQPQKTDQIFIPGGAPKYFAFVKGFTFEVLT
jgi:hypothetical protein